MYKAVYKQIWTFSIRLIYYVEPYETASIERFWLKSGLNDKSKETIHIETQKRKKSEMFSNFQEHLGQKRIEPDQNLFFILLAPSTG